ncbi:hypothetical protein DPMN_080033 [Dreissena polymorpha]|uniref:Uncharacterized protein n=1 Tax=Dreissena polymorpha TaxID=45954 RepID=A0A9D4BRM2_DREPO|nr:hypothetical protein DPMN_080033 [Dreissena polymorpha]
MTTVRQYDGDNSIGTNLLTKFHEDRKINVASRVLTRNNTPPSGSHVFQPAGIIFEVYQDNIWMNLLTKFHEDRTVNVASRGKNALPHGSHIFQANIILNYFRNHRRYHYWTINVASRVLTRENAPPLVAMFLKQPKPFSDSSKISLGDWKINVTSRVFTRKNAPTRWWPYIIRMNLLTEFHEDWTINVASRVKNAPPLGSHVFQANVTIFELIQDMTKTNLLTIFYEDWTINVASRVLTRKNAPPSGGHVFQPKGIIFELVKHIFRMNLLTKFHEDWTINVASRVKNARLIGSHVFQAKVSIIELIQDIIGTNLLSKFHQYRKINVASRVLTRNNSPPPGSNVHEVQTINVAFRVLTRFYYSHIRKKKPPLGSHVFQANVTIFELIQDIIETNLLTKFHEDSTINEATKEITRQMLTAHDGRCTTDKKRSYKLTMSTLCSG